MTNNVLHSMPYGCMTTLNPCWRIHATFSSIAISTKKHVFIKLPNPSFVSLKSIPKIIYYILDKYMPSTYLFLSEAQRSDTGTSGARWLNLPTLSQSTRECYLSLVNCSIVFDALTTHKTIVVKMKIPTSNYFSSDNEDPCVAFLSTVDQTNYEFVHDNKIQLLTNDQLKSIEFILEDNNGSTISIDAGDSMEVMLKLDYVDQKEQVMGQLQTVPQRL